MGFTYYGLGIEFEDLIIEKFGDISNKEWGLGAFRMSTVQQDRFLGTDCFVLGIPIDITLNFDSKNYTSIIGQTLDLAFAKISFGLREGNKKAKFKTPVLVIGVDTPITWHNAASVVSMLTSSIKTILEKGMDYYVEATEEV